MKPHFIRNDVNDVRITVVCIEHEGQHTEILGNTLFKTTHLLVFN